MALDVPPPADDAIGERHVRRAALQLAHLEPVAALALYIKAAAVALGSKKHAIVAGPDGFGEVGVELDHGTAALELRRAEILEPELRALHAIERAMSAVGKRHRGTLRAHDEEIAPEEASVATGDSGLTINTYCALGVARDAGLFSGRAEHTDVLGRGAHDAGHGIDGVGNARSIVSGKADHADGTLRGSVDAVGAVRSSIDAGAPAGFAADTDRVRRAEDADVGARHTVDAGRSVGSADHAADSPGVISRGRRARNTHHA